MKKMKMKLENHPFFIKRKEEGALTQYVFQEEEKSYVVAIKKDELDWKTNDIGVFMLSQAPAWFIENYNALFCELMKKNRVRRLMEGKRMGINLISRHYYLLPFQLKYGYYPKSDSGMSGLLKTKNGFVTNEYELALQLFSALKDERHPVVFEEKEDKYCIKVMKEEKHVYAFETN
jgi:hypothetical protein